MMNSENQIIQFRKLLEELLDICVKLETGIAYIVTDNSELAEIRIESGNITYIKFRNTCGIEALRLLKQIERAKYSFNNKELSKSVDESEESKAPYLPSTFHIFQLLGLDSATAAPLKTISTTSKATSSAVSKETGNKKVILVVEDSALSRKVILRALADKNYTIIEAEDGFQALAVLGNIVPDLVLLDLILPKTIDGYKVLAHMKKRPEHANIPVIILTSRDTLLDKLRGKMSEADEYLTKPFPPNELLEKVEKLLAHEPKSHGYS